MLTASASISPKTATCAHTTTTSSRHSGATVRCGNSRNGDGGGARAQDDKVSKRSAADEIRHPVRRFPCPECPADILRGLPLPHGFEHRSFNLLGFAGQPQMSQHHRRRKNRAKRI